ncbi:hypothetical protein EMCRGX_G013983 [Ephydatia muelleri]
MIDCSSGTKKKVSSGELIVAVLKYFGTSAVMNLDSRLESLMSPMTEKPLGCLSRCVIGFFGELFLFDQTMMKPHRMVLNFCNKREGLDRWSEAHIASSSIPVQAT